PSGRMARVTALWLSSDTARGISFRVPADAIAKTRMLDRSEGVTTYRFLPSGSTAMPPGQPSLKVTLSAQLSAPESGPILSETSTALKSPELTPLPRKEIFEMKKMMSQRIAHNQTWGLRLKRKPGTEVSEPGLPVNCKSGNAAANGICRASIA